MTNRLNRPGVAGDPAGTAAAAVAAIPADGAAGTPSLRTLGTGAAQAASGTDSRLTNSRAPSGTAAGSLAGTYPNPTIAASAISTTELADAGVTLAKMALAARGNVHGFLSGDWHQTGPGSGTPSAILGVGTERLAAYWIPVAATITAIAAEVTTAGEAGSLFRLIARSDDGSGASYGSPGKPSTLLVDAGTIVGDGATGVKTITGLSASIAAGGRWIWIGGAVQNVVTTQPTMRTISTPLYALTMGSATPTVLSAAYAGYSQTGVTGAAPGSWTGATLAGTVARVAVKLT